MIFLDPKFESLLKEIQTYATTYNRSGFPMNFFIGNRVHSLPVNEYPKMGFSFGLIMMLKGLLFRPYNT